MSWLIADYSPVSFFSLRPAHATASGGQTLLVPTGFALKMAVLNASIQTAGLAEAQRRFPMIRDLRIALRPPDTITVLKSFAKIRRPAEFKDASKREEKIAELSEKGQYPFQSTIAYRELVQFGDPLEASDRNVLRVACTGSDGEPPPWLGESLLAINYLGKRGGFLQIVAPPALVADRDEGFTEVTRDSTESGEFPVGGTLQMLDDCGAGMTFDHANVYEGGKRITLGKERVLRHVVLPYRLTRSSRGYSLYERIEE
jgi:hypothetical protein